MYTGGLVKVELADVQHMMNLKVLQAYHQGTRQSVISFLWQLVLHGRAAVSQRAFDFMTSTLVGDAKFQELVCMEWLDKDRQKELGEQWRGATPDPTVPLPQLLIDRLVQAPIYDRYLPMACASIVRARGSYWNLTPLRDRMRTHGLTHIGPHVVSHSVQVLTAIAAFPQADIDRTTYDAVKGVVGVVEDDEGGVRIAVHRFLLAMAKRFREPLRQDAFDTLLAEDPCTLEPAAAEVIADGVSTANYDEHGVRLSEAQVQRVMSGLDHPDPETAVVFAQAMAVLMHSGWDHLADEVWSRLGLREIEFADHGNGVSTVPAFLELFLQERPPQKGELAIAVLARVAGVNEPFHAVLQRCRVEALAAYEQCGRTTVFPLGGDSSVAMKGLVQPHERAQHFSSAEIVKKKERLLRELRWLDCVAKSGIQLKSQRPLPIPAADGSINLVKPVSNLVPDYEDNEVSLMRVPRDYYRYLDEPGLSDAVFMQGLTAAVHDAFLLARYGVYHTVPMSMFHNQQPGAKHRPNGDRGKYVIWPDIVFDFSARSGMGRHDNWPGSILYGNFGLTGLRDFEELATLDEIMDGGAEWMPELRRLNNKPNAEALYHLSLMSNVLYTAGLYIGNRIVQHAEQSKLDTLLWQDDRHLAKYAKQLLTVFATAYAVQHDKTLQAAMQILTKRVHWRRLARQFAFFATNAHAKHVATGRYVSQFPTGQIYSGGCSVFGHNGQGLMGPYRAQRGVATFDPIDGFIGVDGDVAKRSYGAVNGQHPVRELEAAIGAVFV